MAKNHEAELPMRLYEGSDSDSSSSSSEEEAFPANISLATADKDSADAQTAGSGSDSDNFERPLKSMVSKPTGEDSKMKRPRSRPNSKPNLTASPLKTPTKRPVASEEEKDSKKSKTEKGAWGGEEEKKSAMFQRLWSDEDEVAILEGMIDYKEKKGVDPMLDVNNFHEFIKDSLHISVDRMQVVGKVRRLKKRYKNSWLKKKASTNPHEKKIIELSKKVWGQKMEREDLDQEIKGKTKTRTISKRAATNNSTQNGETEPPARNKSSSNYNGKKEVGNSGEGEKVEISVQFLGKASVSMGLDETIVNAGLELCSDDKKVELENKWRELHLEESDLFLRKLDLARQESELITAALRSGGK